MSEFINEFGKENFIIMISIVGVIVVILFIIILIEKHNSRKIIKSELKNIKENAKSVKRNTVIQEPVEAPTEKLEMLDVPLKEEPNGEVYYTPIEPTATEAKEKLEAVTKRLIDEDENNYLIDHTHFENEQEEKSIISYDELVKASHDIDEKNDKLLADEDEAAITLEELYRKHEDEQNIIEKVEEQKEVKVNNPVFVDETKKFKNSEVISPVFGIYSGEIKKPEKVLKEIDKKMDSRDLENEIQRTEDFLSELKKLKNKLD